MTPRHPATDRAEGRGRFAAEHPEDVVIHALAIRLAKQCREVIQGCLREEESRDCDTEFYRIIHEGLGESQATSSATRVSG